MCSSETKPQPARPILIFAIADASSGRRSMAKRDGVCRLQPAMIRLDIAYRTRADGRPLAVFRFAPNSENSHAIPTQICKRALDHSVWPITSVCCGMGVSQEPLSLAQLVTPTTVLSRRSKGGLERYDVRLGRSSPLAWAHAIALS